MVKSLEELRKKRQLIIDAHSENESKEGLRNLLTQLYPDKAHFTYELLQNAEDAGATSVIFELHEDNVKFTHNGSKLFTLEDVDSITNLKSTKKDDPTKIGEFGVGFKAVFSYTETPEIHSGDFHFRIRDLFVPEVEGVEKIKMEDNKTHFIFPFNHIEKPQHQAFSEIKKSLNELNNNTLLFLKKIKYIEYKFLDEEDIVIERNELNDNVIEISTKNKKFEKEIKSQWLRYEKDVIIKDNIKRRIAIAYKIENDKIVPLDKGSVFIYFPAAKEESNLKFHIHAPFASTVARDSVRDCEDNKLLRDEISGLIVSSLNDIKIKGLLTTSFLSVMPNPVDNLSPYYEPIRLAVIDAFNKAYITPTLNGKHRPASTLYRSYPKKISDALGESGLVFFTNDKIAQWVANPNQINQREDKFLETLNIKEFGWQKLAALFKNKSQNEKKKVEEYITKKDDYSLLQLYSILGEACGRSNTQLQIDFNIVRIREGEHVTPDKAFIPTEKSNINDDKINYVSSRIYSASDRREVNSYVYVFLECIGVKKYDIDFIINTIIENYEKNKKQSTNEHLSDIRNFINYFENNKLRTSTFKYCKFLKVENSENSFYRPQDIFIDSPYEKTNLKNINTIHNKNELWQQYKAYLSEKELELFLKFIKSCGVMYKIAIDEIKLSKKNPDYLKLRKNVEMGIHKERSEGMETLDFYINNLDNYLNKNNFSMSLLIWNTLLTANPCVAQAMYKPNKSIQPNYADSLLVHKLKNEAWIPDKNCKFYKPNLINISDLHPKFKSTYNVNNILFTKIGLGEREKVQNAKYKELNERANAIGFKSIDEAKMLQQLRDMLKNNNISIEQHINSLTYQDNDIKSKFPTSPVHNPERRAKIIEDDFSEAPKTEYGQKLLSVKTSDAATKIDAKQMLRAFYTNKHNVMLCQICEKEMAFRKLAKDNHEYYFETVEIFSGNYFKKEHQAKYIALCPICAAKYNYFIKKSYMLMDEIQDCIRNFEGNRYTIPIKFDSEQATIRFVEKHFFDLTNILKFNK